MPLTAPPQAQPPKPGWQTSEFWLTVLPAAAACIIAIILALRGDVDKAIGALGIATGGGGLYALARGITKRG